LKKSDPNHFGVSLATIDGHIYEVGDCNVPFTIQSISKAFVFALALELLGAETVEAIIGVEPSGDSFNSIRLRHDNRPHNPMVNSGAIACSGLIHCVKGKNAFDYIRAALGRFAGRDLDVDEPVFASERDSGDRNRAIAYLLRNYGVVKGDVDAVLDIYFRQCSVLVTARDLAIMAATLANNGVNPAPDSKPRMVSESVSCPVSMMIGALKPFLRRIRTASRPSISGNPTSMITRSIWPASAACTPLLPFSAATASNSSSSESCSISASRNSGSSSTMRILRVFGISIRACPSPRFAACRPRPFRRLTPDRSDRAVAVPRERGRGRR
jgi:hypothetical protein